MAQLVVDDEYPSSSQSTCSWGLNPLVSRSDLAMVCRPRDYADRPVNALAWRGCRVEPVNITIGGGSGVGLI